MSKELEALKNIKQDYCKYRMCPQSVDACKMCDIGIIETALRGYGNMDKENKLLRENFENLDETYFDTWYVCEKLKENGDYALMFVDDLYCLVDTKDNEFEVIDTYKVNSKGIIDNESQKKLKSLDIIKKKNVNVGAFNVYDNLEQYNNFCKMFEGLIELTQEEFDSLKEVLQ